MEKQLKDILKNVSPIGQVDTDVAVSGIQIDSRLVSEGDVFVALKGTAVDGHKFIPLAIEKGARAIVCAKVPDTIDTSCVCIQVDDTKAALTEMLNAFYENPTDNIKLVGVTGTNGKTTTATLLYRLFSGLGYNCGLLSTVCNYVGDKQESATHTTPDPVSLYKLLNQMVAEGCHYCFMEVSSHAIDQGRIDGLKFIGGVFSNITRDHLDYHKTFEEYLRVKKLFFDGLPSEGFALVNADDKNGPIMLQNTEAHEYTYGLHSFADFKSKVLESSFDGMLLTVEGSEFWTKYTGEFNAYNLLAVYATAILLGEDKEEILRVLSQFAATDGRFECFKSDNGVTAIVDYAHTPDALKNVMATISKIRTRNESLITVVGAGGERDKGKRPMMGKVAAMFSEKVIFTSDNPRSEDPALIAKDMADGVEPIHTNRVLTIVDRKEAIKTALMLAQPKDIVLIAGKGHEDYQIINGEKLHFDDRELVKEIFGIK